VGGGLALTAAVAVVLAVAVPVAMAVGVESGRVVSHLARPAQWLGLARMVLMLWEGRWWAVVVRERGRESPQSAYSIQRTAHSIQHTTYSIQHTVEMHSVTCSSQFTFHGKQQTMNIM
jgi:hypothetical protein